MGFLVFVGMIIGACIVGKKIYEDKQYKDARADAEWRERMRQQSLENETIQYEQQKQKIIDDEYREAVVIADKFRKEAELVIFEEKCLKSPSNITLDCKTFFDFEIDNINGRNPSKYAMI